MAFQLLPSEPSDVPEIADIHHEAFKDDPILGQLMRDVPLDRKHDYDRKFFEKAFAQAPFMGSVFHKVVDTDTGKIVAYARWKYPYTLTPAQAAEKAQLDLSRSYPEGTNVELYEEFFRQLDAKRKKFCDDEKDYFLHILIVAPGYQRRGLGSMLIREGLAHADRDNARAYVEASAKGLGLYKKFGWKPVGEITMDMTSHGGKGVEVEELLIREPNAGPVQ
ncbi:MAG: hypothetical protein L6R39_001757 [Caloplaca ligustica]|nr:MAG: hypothetical protein L6R39_001757 [Caloplaca ligustica]